MKLFSFFLVCLFCTINMYSQSYCQAVSSENDGMSLLMEYNLGKIQNNEKLVYKRTLYSKDKVDIIDFCGDYAIVIFAKDTFAVECGSLKSDCNKFNEYAYRINLRKAIEKYGEDNMGLLPIQEQARVLGNKVFIHGVNDKKKHIPINEGSFLQVIGLVNDKAYVQYEGNIYWTYIDALSSSRVDQENDRIRQEKENILLEQQNKLREYIYNLQSENDFIKAIQPFSVYIRGSSVLYDVFTNISTVVTGDLTFIGIKDNKAYVIYKDKLYRTDYGNLSSPALDSIYTVMDNRAKEEKKRDLQRQKMNIEKRKQRLIAEYGEEAASAILKGSVYIGMSKKMAIEAWGRPSKVNTTTTKYGVHEQWVYGGGNYLYFEDGELTSIQN